MSHNLTTTSRNKGHDPSMRRYLVRSDNRPDSDDAISVTREHGLTISGPGQRDTLRNGGFFTDFREFRSDFIDDALAFQIPDFNTRSSSSTQPVSVGGEAQGIDDISSFQRVQVFAINQIPQHGDAVLATRSAQRTIRRDGDGVDVSSVTVVVGLEFAFLQVPNLYSRNEM
jgi:hypothetical protein